MYGFKIRDKLTTMSERLNEAIMSNKDLKKSLDEIRFQFRQEASNAIFFDNVKVKIIYDKKHKPLLLKEGDKAYLKLHKGYKLSKNNNRKFSNQRCDPFFVKRRIDRFVYELKLPSRWKVHSVISIA